MRFLLDTHLLLWAASGTESKPGSSRGLSRDAVGLINDRDNELMFSAASIWEVAIKNGLGRADFRADPHALRRGLAENGYVEMPVTSEHAAAVNGLPAVHRDPFDRLLVAQAMVEGVTLMTSDTILAKYGDRARIV